MFATLKFEVDAYKDDNLSGEFELSFPRKLLAFVVKIELWFPLSMLPLLFCYLKPAYGLDLVRS